MKMKIVCAVFLITESCLSQGVKINELMYAPANGEPEWIELYNGSSGSVNVKNWKIRNKNVRFYILTTSDCFVKSDSYIVLTKSDTISSFHPTIPSRVLICSALPAAFMVNTGDTISIHDSTGALVDSILYLPSWGGSGGESLERIFTETSPFLSTNWGTSIDVSGSTPGKKNSISARDYDLKITDLSAVFPSEGGKVKFGINVKNRGSRQVSSFGVAVFLDYNNDSILQSGELVVESDIVAELKAGDSTAIALTGTPGNLRAKKAFAVIEFSSDQDTTNNFMWTKLKFTYREKCLVVNEIMYAPKSPEPEWVELYNGSADSVNIEGFTLSDNSGTKVVITTGYNLLPPKGFVVVAHDSIFFSVHANLHDNILITKIPSLNNSGDAVVVHDAAGGLIDSVNYSPSWGGNTGGKSLERILSSGGSDDPQNFETCSDPTGSTPAKVNSETPRDFDLAIGAIKYSPCPVQAGKDVTISASIVNRGFHSSGLATVVLSMDKNGDGVCEENEKVDSTGILNIAAGDSASVDFNSGKLSAGIYGFGISIDYHDDEVQANNSKTCVVNVGLPAASVVINEIMYAPKSPEQEWLELYNTTNAAVDLSNFKIGTHGGSTKMAPGAMIGPQDFGVICKDSSVSRFHYTIRNHIVQSIPSLSNSGDWIAIYDNLGNLLDSINYVPSYGGSSGKSLERIDYFAGSDSTNWHESVDSTGATPGMVNSTATLPYDISLKRLECPGSLAMNQQANIFLVIQNTGRNSMTDVRASIEIYRVVDGVLSFSGEQTLSSALMSGDSTSAGFIFTPLQAGTYGIFARISQQQDQRFWDDTLSARVNIRYQPQSIVINEIMYTKGNAGEYFEIYNTSQNPIDIANWMFHTSSQPKPTNLSPIDKILSPNNYFLVASDSAILDFLSDTSLVDIARSMSLRDDGGCIVLMDPSGSVVDSVYYLPSWHNGDVANTLGRSLEKINPTLPSNEKTSWSTSVSQTGGTPGKKNSLFVEAGSAVGSISVSPNPFSPDGDGKDDFSFISYTFPVSSVKVKVRIFDSIGRLIATPADNSILPSTGKIVWDGRDSSGKIVKFGMYILLVEMTGPNGNSLSVYKKPLVVAKKMK